MGPYIQNVREIEAVNESPLKCVSVHWCEHMFHGLPVVIHVFVNVYVVHKRAGCSHLILMNK